jgi:hypothetical protein
MKVCIIILIIVSFSCFGQRIKTLKDSVFDVGDVIRIPVIEYGLSKPCCWPPQIDSIRLIGDFLNKHKNLGVELACHTDARGSKKFNRKLSVFRVKQVWQYLTVELKIDPAQVRYKGYGESKPIIRHRKIRRAKTSEEQNRLHLMNQRTELIVLKTK